MQCCIQNGIWLNMGHYFSEEATKMTKEIIHERILAIGKELRENKLICKEIQKTYPKELKFDVKVEFDCD